MILNIKEGNEWQFLEKNGFCILPWYTRPSLDVLEKINLSDKSIFEYGCGMSTIYYAHKAKHVSSVDSNESWVKNINHTLLHHSISSGTYLSVMYNEDEYVNTIKENNTHDIIVVDGSYRDACTIRAIEMAKAAALVILDNWMQPSVEIASQQVQDLVNQYPHTIYKQPGHPDWQTLILTK